MSLKDKREKKINILCETRNEKELIRNQLKRRNQFYGVQTASLMNKSTRERWGAREESHPI